MAIFAVRRNHHNWARCLIVNDGLPSKTGSFTRMGNQLRLDCARRSRHRWSLLRLKCARLSVFLLQKGENWLTVLPLELTRSPCGWGGQLSNDCCYAKQETTPALLQWKLGMTPAPAFLKGWKVLEHSEIIVHGRFLSMVSAYGALIPPLPPGCTRTRTCCVAVLLLLCAFKLLMRPQWPHMQQGVVKSVIYQGETFALSECSSVFATSGPCCVWSRALNSVNNVKAHNDISCFTPDVSRKFQRHLHTRTHTEI